MKDRKDDFVVSDAMTWSRPFPLKDLLTLNYLLRYRDGYNSCREGGPAVRFALVRLALLRRIGEMLAIPSLAGQELQEPGEELDATDSRLRTDSPHYSGKPNPSSSVALRLVAL